MSILDPGRELRFRRAFSAWSRGVAPPPLDRFAALAPTDPGARWCLGICQAENGLTAESLATLAPERPAFLALAQLWAGEPGAALTTLGDDKGLLETSIRGLAHLEEERPDLAAAAWRRSPPMHWRLTGPRAFAQVLRHLHRQDPEGCGQRLAQDLADQAPPRPMLPARLFRRGLDLCEQILPRLRGDREMLARIGILSFNARGDNPEAITRARAARRDFPDQEWPGEMLLELLAQEGRDKEILDLRLQGREYETRRAIALARLGRWQEAEAILAPLPLHPDLQVFQLYARGCALALTDRIDAATRVFIELRRSDEVAFQDVSDREAGLFIKSAAASGATTSGWS